MRFLSVVATAAAFVAHVQAAPAPEAGIEEDPRNLEERASRFKYYNLHTPLSGPCDLATGPDGNIWVSNFLEPTFAVVNVNSGAVKEYPIPYTSAPLTPPGTVPDFSPANKAGFACVMRHGRDGNMYAATGVRNQFAVINPTTKNVTLYQSNGGTTGNLEPFNDAWAGVHGIWFTQTTAGSISFFDYSTKKITVYPVPDGIAAGPLGMFIASDNGLWFSEFFGQKIGRLDLKTKKIETYPIPDANMLNPAVVRAETFTKGKHLIWFCGIVGNGMGAFNAQTRKWEATYQHTIPAGFPTEDAVDGNGKVWYSTLGANYLNRLDPATGKITTFRQPGLLDRGAVDIAMHYGPGRDMWFTELKHNRVGRFTLYGQRNAPNPFF